MEVLMRTHQLHTPKRPSVEGRKGESGRTPFRSLRKFKAQIQLLG